MKTKIIVAIAAIVTIGIVALAIKVHSPEPNCQDPRFASYISAYTESPVSKASTIKVVLNSSLADSLDISKIDMKKVLRIYPSIEGTTKFADERTIEFTPAEPLMSGHKYIVELRLRRIAKVPGDLRKFVFPVTTIAQDMKVNIEDQVTIDRTNLVYQQVSGSVKTADVETIENVRKAVTAKAGNTSYNIKWRETELGDIFNFTIDSVKRSNESQYLTISYDGKAIKAKTSGEKKIEIPALNVFAVSSVKVLSTPSQHIRIQFTDPVDSKQDLDGLITVVGTERNSNDSYTMEVSDNCVNIYPKDHQEGGATVYVAAGIRNILGTKISDDKSYSIDYEMQKPQIRSVKTGLILPDGEDGLVYPFEAVNLTAVDVTIIKVLEKNILSYIRDYNEGWNSGNLQQTGVPVFRKTIHINDRNNEDVSQWRRYYLELSKLIKTEPGSIYNIKIAFRKSHAIFDCDTCNGGDDCSMEKDLDFSDFDNYQGYYESLDNNYYESCGWDWKKSENPCYKMYYRSHRFLSQNILASNLGMIAKKGGDESTSIYITDLKTTYPVPDAVVELYGYQQQLLATRTTDNDGKADFGPMPKGYFAVARRGNECNYLKIRDGNSLSLSKFDISGKEVQNGLKGFIYGERGVWRPGDSIHLSFVLKEDAKNPLPSDYPITMEVRNPQQQQIYKETVEKNKNNFYVFGLKTDSEAQSGNYEATVTCGNARFYKNLRIENVLPNRLKINTTFNKETFGADKNIISIESQWLHGAVAHNLETQVDLMLTEKPLSFDQWKGYSFSDAKNPWTIHSNWDNVFSGKLDDNGNIKIPQNFDGLSKKYPNMMRAHYSIRVYEKGGRFSKDEASIDVKPYNSYVGIKLPDTDGHFLNTDEPQKVNLVVCDNDGKTIKGKRSLRVKLYKMEWQWWYDASNYVSEYNSELISTENVEIDGTGSYTFMVKYPQWGRFLIDVTDMNTGISASQFFYMDWPESYGRSAIMSQGSTIVELSKDKDKYQVGDIAQITIPSNEGGHALVTVENGTKVISSQWISTKAGKTEFKLKIEPSYEPGVYVFVETIQPHAQTANDMPIRMYGVIPLDVENPETHIEPVITMPDVLEADKDVKITVSEKDNKKMTYTIALVDDGLLDLTHYKTPDPWKEFYSREALGVKTIDMYDNVIGAFGGTIEKMFSIGGDDDSGPTSAAKANNFESVVAFLGPFTTNGAKQTHTIKMPKYIGSVRAMVVAGNGKAYGKAEKTCKVTKPLMVFATTPRIIGTDEQFSLPITVFAGDDNIKNVSIKIKASDGLTVEGDGNAKLTFNGKGEQNPAFSIKSGNKTGVGTIEILASSGNHVSKIDLKLEIRQPNNYEREVISKVVAPGQTVSIPVTPTGRPGTNTASISINGILPINYENHLLNLVGRPYESLEHIVCKAFPLIYAPVLSDVKGITKERGENMIRDAIKKVYSYQSTYGGLSYWKNQNYTNVWITSLAGHFMLEAKKAGYSVNQEFIDKWKKFQKLKAESWTPDSEYSYHEQAYRLYTLALAGEAPNAQMNRLKEMPQLTDWAKVFLAGAYALSGKKQIGQNIIKPIDYCDVSYDAPKLISLCDLNDEAMAFPTASDVSRHLADPNLWLCTEDECMMLVAMGKYFEKYKPVSNIKCSYTFGSSSEEISSDRIFVTKDLKIDGNNKETLTLTNNSDGNLYIEINKRGIPEAGQEKTDRYMIEADVRFYQGRNEISPKKLKQGEDFTAVVKIKNFYGQHRSKLAITQMFPSGWEILNSISNDDDDDYNYYDEDYYSKRGTVLYTDIRDDRKYTYFSLPGNGEMEFRTHLTATYAGTYYLPGIVCEDLEHPQTRARTKGMMITVEKD
ncbi:MAG: MG2 domain-containing protein [Bacteroidales bacterium]|nr:MG2 domain-containing protein [Bacteroidales bacterium]